MTIPVNACLFCAAKVFSLSTGSRLDGMTFYKAICSPLSALVSGSADEPSSHGICEALEIGRLGGYIAAQVCLDGRLSVAKCVVGDTKPWTDVFPVGHVWNRVEPTFRDVPPACGRDLGIDLAI